MAICVGASYRAASACYAVGFTYVFLLEQAHYLNHHYLVVLLAWQLPFLPANRALSVDAALDAGTRSATIPAWSLWVIRAQVGIVYVFGGIAKLGADWLGGRPMIAWVTSRSAPGAGYPLCEALVWLTGSPRAAGLALAWGGMAFDLAIVPLLLWRRTRPVALAVAIGFHAANELNFSIGIFPYMATALTLSYLDPGWPRRILPTALLPPSDPAAPPPAPPTGVGAKALTCGLIAFYAIQLWLPLRGHVLWPGDSNWTEEGHQFSWRMMLRSKTPPSEHRHDGLYYVVRDPATGETWIPELSLPPFEMPAWQYYRVRAAPNLIVQYAQRIEEVYRQSGKGDLEVYADSVLSLNTREYRRMIDPHVDLTQVELGWLRRWDFVLPFGEQTWGPDDRTAVGPKPR
jgi:hypothetical protein